MLSQNNFSRHLTLGVKSTMNFSTKTIKRSERKNLLPVLMFIQRTRQINQLSQQFTFRAQLKISRAI